MPRNITWPVGRDLERDAHPAERRLATAGLADEAERLPGTDAESTSVTACSEPTRRRSTAACRDGELLRNAAELDDVLVARVLLGHLDVLGLGRRDEQLDLAAERRDERLALLGLGDQLRAQSLASSAEDWRG